MKYLAILGQNRELSLAELFGVYSDLNVTPLTKETAILETAQKIDINELGGLPKLAEIVAIDVSSKDIKKIIVAELLKLGKDQKVFFGLSFYNSENRGLYNSLGKEIKSALKDGGGKARWAISRELALSSVYIRTNKLLTRGFDFNIVFHNGMAVIAKTIAVQDFADYEFRDMRRPRRDLYSGMTPTKLAKLLINLSSPLRRRGGGEDLKITFLDPFCGSGTFLIEAALLGFQNIYGSDISDKAVADSKENMAWLKKFYKFDAKIEIKKCRAEEALKCWNKKFDYIVTEPYLGPPVRGELPKHKAIDLQKELGLNYEKYLSGLGAILNPGGYLVLIVPFFITEKGDFFLPLKLKENGLVAVPPLPKTIYPELSIKYCRPDQKIGREIFILKKI